MAGEFIYNNSSNTPARYRFSLLNGDNQLLILKTPPMEWSEGEIEIMRDINVGGVFTYYTSDTLTFVKEGAKFLRDIWDQKEINGSCQLIVEYFKFSTHSYVEMPSRFSLDFSTARPRVKVGNQSIGFEISAIKEDILVKLENRRDKEIDISKIYTRNNTEYIKTMGGAELKTYPNLNKTVTIPPVTLKFVTQWTGNYTGIGRIDNNKDVHYYTEFQMDFLMNDNKDAQEIDYRTYRNYTGFTVNPCMIATETYDISFFYNFGILVTNRKAGQKVYAVFVEVRDERGFIKSSERVADVGNKVGFFQFDDSLNLTLEENDRLYVYIRTDDTRGIDAYIQYSTFVATRLVVQYSGRDVDSFPVYEAIERTLQHITDIQYPFYSEFFGRTDTYYNSNNDAYASENQTRFANILSGLNLRGAKLDQNNNPLPITFDDLFKSINSIWNVGYEVETISGTKRIRIENYDYFFNDVQVLDLSDRLSRYDIESEVMPEFAYSQIKCGFKDYTYERINGRGEFNTESSFTSIINTDKTYDILSEIRADTMGITAKITEELSSEDTEEDNELFILKTQRNSSRWKLEKDENITIEEESSLFGEDTMNLYFTPVRMLLRHGNRIKGAFLKYLQSLLIFQTSNKEQSLKTTGEGYTVTENENIVVNDLATPIYKPIKHVVSCRFTFDDFETLMQNPKGYIKFSDDISGYLLSLKKKNNVDEAVIEIIEKI